MRGRDVTAIMILAAALAGLAACGRRDSIYLDHNREEAARAPPKPAARPTEPASTNATVTNSDSAAPAT